MKEKNIFIGILVLALLGVGTIAYRSYYRQGDGYRSEGTQSSISMPNDPAAANMNGQKNNTPVSIGVLAVPEQSSGMVENKLVRYDGTRFSPSPITIKVGSTITFMNESGRDMWPASAPHPTHTDYPGFDAAKPIKPGQSYSFIFTKAGIWKYHNHLDPTKFGSVTVTK